MHAAELDPAALAEIESWASDPELGRLVTALRSHVSRKAFFDTYAEAMVARRLLARGCSLRFEIPTPNGRRCDFEVRRDGLVFFLHVKRLDTDRAPHNAARLMMAWSKLRILERIARPYVIQVRFHEGLDDHQMQVLVHQAEQFITQAHVGDELKARDESGLELGGVRVIAPYSGTHVSVTIGLPSGFVDQAPRFRRLLHRAHQQFMPRQTNVILVGSGSSDDARDFDIALLGSHIERWDSYPPRGRRLAHGRATDGFWHARHFLDSHYAAWFVHAPGDAEIFSRLWVRREVVLEPEKTELLSSLF